jgi:hypothetical protein
MIEGGYVQRPYAARFANAWLTGVTLGEEEEHLFIFMTLLGFSSV